MAKIVMTGATSGIGQGAARLLVKHGHGVSAGARGGELPNGVTALPLDLASLASVRAFADLCTGPIDALVLNAGTQVQSASARSADGYELTFAVNHLAHYLLARLLLPKMAKRGRIILTSSGTHDPLEKTGVPAPRHADARRLADPTSDPQLSKSAIAAGLRAYSTSKLCNLLTARSLAALPQVAANEITVHAFDPGFIPATKLGRNAPWIFRGIVLPVLALLPPGKGGNRMADGAKALAGLSDGSIDSERVYMALRKGKATWPEPSELARDDAVCAKLWADSAELVGLPA